MIENLSNGNIQTIKILITIILAIFYEKNVY